ncbi:Oidioi.mRNA.OKI2018_I69.XSR.g16407.t1.cds [Oikopleura dioica]|uniref:Oidioi.mRNA.OKI2018_I69.XSR.g16407.t1.cds n=1 Tax=Oikopleura dioica TaxID=34765 RepID=A0ABN7SL46_OIKDI|nr:Oidioi.mRNA.OKI2018_I69.XSR.g16407.t1.cds [Oikopleura dioica]
MKGFNMNTYMYAPKHDDKHRHNWRSKYDLDELKNLKSLIENSKENGVDFVFSMAPGLDLRYSCNIDLEQLLNKFMDIKELGCQSFAILFDDINEDLSPEDARNFESPAHAQASVANFIFEKLGPEIKHFLFCPTEYCASFAKPNVEESEYLSSLGKMLHPDMLVMWTGPRVVSRTISVESIEQIRKIFRRPPVIWDNIHANDYDRRRFYLGPFAGRHSDLVGLTAGVLTNPNCQYDFNYVAMHSLTSWFRSFSLVRPRKQSTASSGDEKSTCEEEHKSHGRYCPRRALVNALSDWLPSFTQTSPDRIELEDLLLLADFYYLPYEYGEDAFRCVQQLMFCANKVSLRASEQWINNFNNVQHLNEKISTLADRMSRCAISDSPAAMLLPFLIDVSNIFTLAIAYIQFIADLGHILDPSLIPVKEFHEKESYDYIDDDDGNGPELAIVHKIASILPRNELNSFILNEISTPWFPGTTLRFSEPSRTRENAFRNSADNDMEFDDATLWPSSDLQRLDDLEIDDELISFSINLSIHPLDHGAALVLRDNKKARLHFAVRSKTQIASLHSMTLLICSLVNILSAQDYEIIEVHLGEQTEPFQNVLEKMHFIKKNRAFFYVLK